MHYQRQLELSSGRPWRPHYGTSYHRLSAQCKTQPVTQESPPWVVLPSIATLASTARRRSISTLSEEGRVCAATVIQLRQYRVFEGTRRGLTGTTTLQAMHIQGPFLVPVVLVQLSPFSFRTSRLVKSFNRNMVDQSNNGGVLSSRQEFRQVRSSCVSNAITKTGSWLTQHYSPS